MEQTAATVRPADAEQVTVYYDPGAFCAWPFSHGLWSFPDGEVVAAFSRAPCPYERAYDLRHILVDLQLGEYVTLRSPDGGRTWPREGLQSLGNRYALERALLGGAVPSPSVGPPDWTSPDFCLTAGFGIPPEGAKQLGYIQFSRDRGQTWEGPFRIPALGFSHLQVKPDYVVRADGIVLLFVTVAREDAPPKNGRYSSRFVAVYASPDQGTTWRYLSSILSDTADRPFIERYYASPVLFPDGRILVALRCQLDGQNAWPEVHESVDGGWTWRRVSRIADWGGPTHLSRLPDGRVLAVYGRRLAPYGIRARVSEDGALTWGPEIILRDDGGSHDLGYPRVCALPGGRVLAAYYFNRADDPIQCNGGVRHIAATIFSP